jgi:hypothetical protein
MTTKEILERLNAIALAEYGEQIRFCNFYTSPNIRPDGEINIDFSLTIFFLKGGYIGSGMQKSIDDAFEMLLINIRKSKTDYSTSELIEI